MTISLRASSALRCLFVVVLTATSVVAVYHQSHWLLVVALSFLATIAIFKTANVFLYWPVGLLSLVAATYANYVWQWVTDAEGVTQESSKKNFLILIALFASVAIVRSITNKKHVELPRFIRGAAIVVMVALPVALMVLVTLRWLHDPVRIISGHLGGGDHGPHNKIVHGLLRESGQVSFVSPFQMYSYPQSLHFFIANLVALTRSTSDLPLLAQEYAMGAWFEWLQFAAFCQLSIVIFMRNAQSAYRVLFVPVFVFVFASMDNFVVQMLWSGFTTSIGITWILLVAVLFVDKIFLVDRQKEVFQSILVLILFALVSWTVYQPYAAIFVFLIGALSIKALASDSPDSKVLTSMHSFLVRPLVLIIGTAGCIISLLLVIGQESPAVTSLSLEGSTFKPFLYTVLLWSFLSIAITRYRSVGNLSRPSGVELFSIIHLGFVAGIAGTVVLTSDYGFLDLPYYPQKMLWTLLFVSLPIALAQGFSLVEDFLTSRTRPFQYRVVLSMLIAAVLVPLVQGRAPTSATKHVTVEWFAQGMVLPIDNTKSSAFSMRDKLGSHMANLALQSVSTRFLTPDVAISGNPYLACRLIETNRTSTVFTTPNGRNELVGSGCNPDITYIEEGIQLSNPDIKFFEIEEDVVERPALGQLGFRLLLRGFLPPEKWGTWAGGYRSALGFNLPDKLNDPGLVVVLRPYPRDEEAQEVVLSANGIEIGRTTVGFESSQRIEVSLPKSSIGSPVELTITCTRSDEEIIQDDPVDGPDPCVGVRSLKLLDRS